LANVLGEPLVAYESSREIYLRVALSSRSSGVRPGGFHELGQAEALKLPRLDLLCIPPVVGVSRLLVHDTLLARIGCCFVFDLSSKGAIHGEESEEEKSESEKEEVILVLQQQIGVATRCAA
jgi:hypothetical protein